MVTQNETTSPDRSLRLLGGKDPETPERSDIGKTAGKAQVGLLGVKKLTFLDFYGSDIISAKTRASSTFGTLIKSQEWGAVIGLTQEMSDTRRQLNAFHQSQLQCDEITFCNPVVHLAKQITVHICSGS